MATVLENYKVKMARLANARKLYADTPTELRYIASEEKLVLSEFEAMQNFTLDLSKTDALVDVYDTALKTYDDAYENVYFDELHGFCQAYEPTPDEEEWLDSVNIWKNLVLSGKMTLFEAVVAELLSFENTLRYYNEKWKNGKATNVVAVGYRIHIYCSDEFRKKVKNWLIEKGLIDPTLKGGYDKKYFA